MFCVLAMIVVLGNSCVGVCSVSRRIFNYEIFSNSEVPRECRSGGVSGNSLCGLASVIVYARGNARVSTPFRFLGSNVYVSKVPLRGAIKCYCVASRGSSVAKGETRRVLGSTGTLGFDTTGEVLVGNGNAMASDTTTIFTSTNVCLVNIRNRAINPVSTPVDIRGALLGGSIILLRKVYLGTMGSNVCFLGTTPLGLSKDSNTPYQTVLVDSLWGLTF